MIFKLYNSDLGIKLNGLTYLFTHVISFVVEDPENNKLIRGGNAGNKVGIAYKEGVKDPKKVTVTIMDLGIQLKGLLDDAFDNQTRMDVFAIDRGDGSSKMYKNSVICTRPQQLNLDENPDSLNVVLMFESFDQKEVMKT